MHKAELLLCLASCLATGTAQATGVPFCGSGAAPTLSNCQDAVNKIDTTTSYSDGAEVDSGDCAIIFHNAGNGGGSATGADAQAAAQAIVNSCNAIGWEYDQNHNNISMQQCIVCEYGTCATCSAPAAKAMKMRKARGARPLLLSTTEDKSLPADARANVLKKRQDDCQSPPNLPTVQCCSAFSAKTSDCIDLGNSLKGQTLTTPFTTSMGGCELAIESTSPNFQVAGDDVGQRIIDDANACNDDPGIVGQVNDTGADGYTFYFGQLCGEFGFGYDGCVV